MAILSGIVFGLLISAIYYFFNLSSELTSISFTQYLVLIGPPIIFVIFGKLLEDASIKKSQLVKDRAQNNPDKKSTRRSLKEINWYNLIVTSVLISILIIGFFQWATTRDAGFASSGLIVIVLWMFFYNQYTFSSYIFANVSFSTV